MTALAQVFSRSRASKAETDIDVLTIIAMFCGVGLFVSLVCATYGVDLSPGFF